VVLLVDTGGAVVAWGTGAFVYIFTSTRIATLLLWV